ncbi:nucleotidyltransferase domain-containing protein [Candidatus Brocadia sinica]|nr:nucleotidyltransferase domain-containing protein [Planctomycetota bacterium]
MLYGSKARGDFLENSDIDLLLITEGSVPIQTKYQVFDIIYKKE